MTEYVQFILSMIETALRDTFDLILGLHHHRNMLRVHMFIRNTFPQNIALFTEFFVSKKGLFMVSYYSYAVLQFQHQVFKITRPPGTPRDTSSLV